MAELTDAEPTARARSQREAAALDAVLIDRLVAEGLVVRVADHRGAVAVIDAAYEAAQEFGDDPQQALVCVIERLEPFVTPLPDPGGQ